MYLQLQYQATYPFVIIDVLNPRYSATLIDYVHCFLTVLPINPYPSTTGSPIDTHLEKTNPHTSWLRAGTAHHAWF
jgi:hypothetical protein